MESGLLTALLSDLLTHKNPSPWYGVHPRREPFIYFCLKPVQYLWNVVPLPHAQCRMQLFAYSLECAIENTGSGTHLVAHMFLLFPTLLFLIDPSILQFY